MLTLFITQLILLWLMVEPLLSAARMNAIKARGGYVR